MLIIAVLSGKGGTGKTTITLNLGLAWALAGKTALLTDYDLLAPSFSEIFPDSYENAQTLNAFLAEESVQPGEIIQPTPFEGVDVTFAEAAPDLESPLITGERQAAQTALRRLFKLVNYLQQESKTKYDVWIIDNHPAVNFGTVNSLLLSKAGIFVVRPSSYGFARTESLLLNFATKARLLKKDRQDYIVFNQVPLAPENELGPIIAKWEESLSSFGAKTLARIPIQYKSLMSIDSLFSQETEIFQACDKIASTLETELVSGGKNTRNHPENH